MAGGAVTTISDQEAWQAQAARYALLSEVVLLIAQSTDLERLLKGAMNKIKWVIDFERATLELLNPDGESYRQKVLLETRRGFPREGERTVPLGEGIAGPTITKRQVRLIEDVASAEDMPPVADEAMEAGEITTILSLPLQAYDEMLGAITFGTTQPHGFGDEDVKVARAFATHLALGIDRWQQTASLTHANDQLRQEITERTRIEQALKESNERAAQAHAHLIDAIETIQEGFALFDSDDRLTICNSKYRELLYPGMEDQVVPGTDYEAILRRAIEFGLILDAIEDPEAFVQERLNRHGKPTGSHLQHRKPGRWLQINERRTQEGGVVAVYTDVTELKQREEELKEMDQLKSNFLSSVSHELRTPLTSVRGFAKLINKDFSRRFMPLAEGDQRLEKMATRIAGNLEIIQSEGERLTRLINDVLDISKIESGSVEWRDDTVVVKDVANQAFNAVSGQFVEKPGVEASMRVADDLPHLAADPDRLVQVLVNLMNNAAKFTDEGVVELIVEKTPEGWVRMSVRDTGAGIPPEDIDKVFDKFHQVTKSDTLQDKPTGTGLGLTICGQIVEHYGGRIWVESELGRGSTFSCVLPPAGAGAKAAETETETPPPVEQTAEVTDETTESSSQDALILVVDDDANVRSYLQQVLEAAAYRVVTASNGSEAVAAAKRHRPDLITMDLLMPNVDGKEAIGLIRGDRALQHIPIVVISALSERDTAGGDISIGKPLDDEHIVASIRMLLHQAGKAANGTAEGKQHFLIVTIPGTETRLPEMPDDIGKIDYCSLDEIEARLDAGFEGTLVLPSETTKKLDLRRLFEGRRVRGVVINGSHT